ncbi:hypothetical protein BJV78DRAFT_893793 [Lactifluus subvellereus]|nr:hypothetical protein BJV78DRAFT_893793 [Lactifluus subvellereus]
MEADEEFAFPALLPACQHALHARTFRLVERTGRGPRSRALGTKSPSWRGCVQRLARCRIYSTTRSGPCSIQSWHARRHSCRWAARIGRTRRNYITLSGFHADPCVSSVDRLACDCEDCIRAGLHFLWGSRQLRSLSELQRAMETLIHNYHRYLDLWCQPQLSSA